MSKTLQNNSNSKFEPSNYKYKIEVSTTLSRVRGIKFEIEVYLQKFYDLCNLT